MNNNGLIIRVLDIKEYKLLENFSKDNIFLDKHIQNFQFITNNKHLSNIIKKEDNLNIIYLPDKYDTLLEENFLSNFTLFFTEFFNKTTDNQIILLNFSLFLYNYYIIIAESNSKNLIKENDKIELIQKRFEIIKIKKFLTLKTIFIIKIFIQMII